MCWPRDGYRGGARGIGCWPSAKGALLWWAAALALRRSGLVPVWYDQPTTFTQMLPHLLDPYSVARFANPPWVAWLLMWALYGGLVLLALVVRGG